MELSTKRSQSTSLPASTAGRITSCHMLRARTRRTKALRTTSDISMFSGVRTRCADIFADRAAARLAGLHHVVPECAQARRESVDLRGFSAAVHPLHGQEKSARRFTARAQEAQADPRWCRPDSVAPAASSSPSRRITVTHADAVDPVCFRAFDIVFPVADHHGFAEMGPAAPVRSALPCRFANRCSPLRRRNRNTAPGDSAPAA